MVLSAFSSAKIKEERKNCLDVGAFHNLSDSEIRVRDVEETKSVVHTQRYHKTWV